ncbi:hypothetical protein RvY_01008-2 [Ramazzottius varieornatus]|uniref:Uncharacterized protein n=1 Tax=Ramazzottius varieornatus TaxID=947166 RepID=A0A1D1UPI9_RAMVA|nr:hypothetical protein RvY_01008-2 [Ramazzottius varieornatus]
MTGSFRSFFQRFREHNRQNIIYLPSRSIITFLTQARPATPIISLTSCIGSPVSIRPPYEERRKPSRERGLSWLHLRFRIYRFPVRWDDPGGGPGPACIYALATLADL